MPERLAAVPRASEVLNAPLTDQIDRRAKGDGFSRSLCVILSISSLLFSSKPLVSRFFEISYRRGWCWVWSWVIFFVVTGCQVIARFRSESVRISLAYGTFAADLSEAGVQSKQTF